MSNYFSQTEVLFPVDEKYTDLHNKDVSIFMPDGKEYEANFDLHTGEDEEDTLHFGYSTLRIFNSPFGLPWEYVTPEGLKFIQPNPDKEAKCRYVMDLREKE